MTTVETCIPGAFDLLLAHCCMQHLSELGHSARAAILHPINLLLRLALLLRDIVLLILPLPFGGGAQGSGRLGA